MQADRHAGVARRPGDQVDVVLAGVQIDVGACMPMRHRDRATASGRSHPRATPVSSPSALRAISRCSSDTPAPAASFGTTMSAASPRNSRCALNLRSCRRGTSTLPSWLPQHVPVVDEQAGSRRAGRPTARSAGSTHGESFSLHGAGAVRQADSVRPRERGPLHQRRLEKSWTVVSIGTSYESLESQLGWPRRSDRVRPSRWLAARFPTRSPPNRACTEVGGRPFGSILAVFGRPTSVIGFTGPRVGMGWAQGSPSLAVGPIPYRCQPASTSSACR